MGLTASQRRNRRLAAGGALAVVLAAGALGLGATMKGQSSAEANASAIPALVPADADTLVIAPFTENWWDKVAPMDEPNKRMPELEPAAAGLPIERIGYSRSVDTEDHGLPFSLPLRLFYLESATAEDAAKVADWIEHEPSADNRQVHVQDTVVIVGSSTLGGYEKPAESVLSVESYDPEQPDGEGTMWMNTGREAVSLTGDGNNEKATAYAGLLKSGFGFETGTKWMGSSSDGGSWAGEFTTGGVDPEAINFEEAVKALSATEEVLAEVEGPTGTVEVIRPGVSGILDGASFVSGTKHMGELADAKGVSSVDEPLITVINDVTGWNAAVGGIQQANEDIATRHVSANADEMVISYQYAGK